MTKATILAGEPPHRVGGLNKINLSDKRIEDYINKKFTSDQSEVHYLAIVQSGKRGNQTYARTSWYNSPKDNYSRLDRNYRYPNDRYNLQDLLYRSQAQYKLRVSYFVSEGGSGVRKSR
ncbi:hypothetical protein [Candidatus Methanodesulfokora washburnensis]|jgi:hypothetical protein|uniref:Uncharacterized protein n=1 Tax=Candidatus Methanodesulfokora washburnensis TaxID=2478471 RepID=A0A429GWY8_9CREN|nr:hypothetical protein [Candidatus Methanodesulfokores washburnensis]RSN78399.1 hypothetical protein D6D85_01035 [Candidatus Methanodesulfokores washburnensis]